jgi:hypothetical protein
LERLEARDCPSYFFTQATNTGIAPYTLNPNDSISWVDVNGDGRPDLWIGAEMMAQSDVQNPPSLYINNGNGTFTDAFSTSFAPNNQLANLNDAEGSVWGDVFNTGSPDLLQTSGGVGGKHISGSFFFVNRQGQLTEEASADGLNNGLHSGRLATFLDWNHDGLPDALVLNSTASAKGNVILYQQTPNGFVDVTAQSGLASDTPYPAWAQSVDLTGHGIPDLLIGPSDKSGLDPLLYQANQGTPGYTLLPDALSALPKNPNITDLAVGDFFNTGYNDLFFVRRFDNQSDVEQGGNNLIAAHMVGGTQTGFTFQSSGTLTFDLGQPSYSEATINTNRIFIGSGGYNPGSLPFTLDPNDSRNQGIMAHDPNNGQGLYIGYDSGSHKWQVYYAAPSSLSPFVLSLSKPVSQLTPIGFDPNAEALRPYLLVYNPTTKSFVDDTVQAGLATPLSAGGVVAGDFNNDGLLDIYVSCEHFLSDQGGVLYLNNGNGTFTAVPATPAYPGIFFSEVENSGGRRPIVADYKGDGTLGLFLPTTKLETPNAIDNDAPNSLFYTQANGNHWIELNLQGVESNREALGAEVFVTAGGVTQRRDVTGGRHTDAQDSNVLHFGLGQSTQISKIIIDWPSGLVQELDNVSADQLVNVVEPGGHSLSQARPITVFSANQTYAGNLTAANPQDFYQFTAFRPVTVQLAMTGPAQIALLEYGKVLAKSQLLNGQQVLTAAEGPGTYFVEVLATAPANGAAYQILFDVVPAAPLISNLVLNPVAAAVPPIVVTATASLGAPGSGFVGGAEFFIDVVGADGTGVPMTAQDGTFDESTEQVIGQIAGQLFANLSNHHHILYIHAEDAQGDWGPFVSMNFVKDSLGPITSQLSVTPSSSSVPPTISATVSDKQTQLSKILSAEYFIDTDGAPGTGTPMTLGQLGDGGVIRLVSAVIPWGVWAGLTFGQHTVYVDGEDVLGNWGLPLSVTFTKTAASASYVVTDFAGTGIWISKNGGPYQNILPFDAQQVAVDNQGEVFARFGASGTWYSSSDQNHWKELDARSASWIGVDGNGDLLADFTGSGLFWFAANALPTGGTPVRLTLADAGTIAMDHYTGDFAADFAGAGVWRCEPGLLPGNPWQQLTLNGAATDANLLRIDGTNDVFADFQGTGLWEYTDALNWQNLNHTDAAFISIAENGNLVAQLQGQGVWRYEQGSWQQLLAINATVLAIDLSGNVTAEFKGHGLWLYGTSWTQLTPVDAAVMQFDINGNLFADLTGFGTWLYSGANGWKHLGSKDTNVYALNS